MRKLVVASKNRGKLREIQEILRELPFEIISMQEAGYDFEIEEKGNTFQENAMLKAQALFQHVNTMVLADDSGLEIDYLGGAPGIYTPVLLAKMPAGEEEEFKIINLLSGIEKQTEPRGLLCNRILYQRKCFTVNGSVEGLLLKSPRDFWSLATSDFLFARIW